MVTGNQNQEAFKYLDDGGKMQQSEKYVKVLLLLTLFMNKCKNVHTPKFYARKSPDVT